MRRFLSLVIAAACCFAATAQPDTPVVRFLKENPRRAAFNTHSYEFPVLHDTPAPKGYEPFYISHYGRHGSRSEWGGAQYAHVRDVLARGAEAGILTPAGDSLMKEAATIYELYDGMDGRLTPRGVREHAAIAERMYHRYSGVFKNGSKHIRAVSSTVPRCIVSMNGFTARLASLQPDLEMDLDTGEKYFAYIGQAENVTIRHRTEEALAQWRKGRDVDTVTVLRNLFTDPVKGKALIGDINRFQGEIYATARVAEAFDIDDNLFRYLPFRNVVYFHEDNFLPAYLNQCNSELNGDLRLPLNKSLADVLIRQADEVIDGKVQKCADLTFGHDWPALGLMNFFGLEGVSARYSIQEAADNWLSSRFCPFATNMQIIFYRSKKSDDILVKFLMNEMETAIPALTPVQGPYYKWTDVKTFCANRVPHAGIIAHRGIWKGNAQNSIASLAKAQAFGCAGSEFDLHLTTDGTVIVNHDRTVAGMDLQRSTLQEVRTHTLANGEPIPTLDEYLTQGEKSRDCLLVLELKPHDSEEQENMLMDKVIETLKSHHLFRPDRAGFISFSHHICRELARRAPGFTVQYLEGDIAPATLHAEGINGIDYHYSVFYKHPEWVKQAHDLGMSVNVWTVDSPEDITAMRELGVDQITTNNPDLTRDILWKSCN